MWELDSVKSFFSVGYTSSRFTWIIFGVRVRNSRNVRKLFTQRVDKISLFQIVPSDLELSLLTSIPFCLQEMKGFPKRVALWICSFLCAGLFSISVSFSESGNYKSWFFHQTVHFISARTTPFYLKVKVLLDYHWGGWITFI